MIEAILTKTEFTKLEELEGVIERGLGSFLKVGNALLEIRDKGLYRATHKDDFEGYCKERWGMSIRFAQMQMAAAKATSAVADTNNCSPESESQARPLTQLDTPEEQREAWTKATESAEADGKPVTAKHVQAAVDEVQTPKKAERINYQPTNGLMYADNAISQLEKIKPNDTQRTRAFERVAKWLAENK